MKLYLKQISQKKKKKKRKREKSSDWRIDKSVIDV